MGCLWPIQSIPINKAVVFERINTFFLKHPVFLLPDQGRNHRVWGPQAAAPRGDCLHHQRCLEPLQVGGWTDRLIDDI